MVGAVVEAREQVDGRIAGQLVQILAVDRLHIDFLEAPAAGRHERQLGIERTFLSRRGFKDSVGESPRHPRHVAGVAGVVLAHHPPLLRDVV